MGNSQPQITRKLRPTRYSKNSYSLDQNSIFSRHVDNPPIERERSFQIPPDNIFTSQASPKKLPLQNKQPQSTLLPSPPETMKRSMTNPISLDSNKRLKQENDQKLSQLNIKNDKLRKELIRISSQLTSRLGKKKFEQKKKEKQQQTLIDKSLPALKKQLQNAYKQITRYKKIISELRSTQSLNNEQVINETEAKLNQIDYQIKVTSNQIEATRNIEKNQQIMLKKAQNELNNVQLRQLKTQVQKLRNKLKVNNKVQRKKTQKERVMQQYMFQLERRLRQQNGEYLPDIKSYANKNYMPDIKDKKKKDQMGNYQPAKWEIKDALQQLRTLKEKHEDYHIKMQKALKLKINVRQANQKLKQDLDSAQKLLQNLHYKRDRYLQLVMGNVEFLMNEQEDDEIEYSVSQQQKQDLRTIIKGNQVPQQVMFDDHTITKVIPFSSLKIVAVNVWYTNKKQISTLQVIYSNGKDCFMGNKTSKTTGQMEKDVLQVEQGDWVKNIMGSFNKKGAIQFLAFNSAKGKAKQFGKQIMNGLNFTFGVTKRQRPICISGYSFFDGSYWRINQLIIDVTYL